MLHGCLALLLGTAVFVVDQTVRFECVRGTSYFIYFLLFFLEEDTNEYTNTSASVGTQISPPFGFLTQVEAKSKRSVDVPKPRLRAAYRNEHSRKAAARQTMAMADSHYLNHHYCCSLSRILKPTADSKQSEP